MRLSILALLGALLCPAQNDQKGALRGRFVDDLFQQGVTKVRVVLTGNGLRDPLITDSDTSGNFSLPALAPGNYTLSVEKAGFFPAEERPVTIEATGTMNLGDVTLIRHRKIRGIVRWQDGEPINTATVQYMPIRAGKPSTDTIGGSRTNDRGEYSMNELRPGRYVIYALYSGNYDRASGLPRRVGLPVFYPASPTPVSAGIVDLRTRAEVTGIDIVLQYQPGVVVEGVVDPSAAFPSGSEASVVLLAADVPGEFVTRTVTKAGERFKFTGVPEGRYLLVSNASSSLSRHAQPLAVGTSDIRDIHIPMPEGVSIEVKFEMEEAVNGQISRTPVSVAGTSPFTPSIMTVARASTLGPYGLTASRLQDGRAKYTDVTDGVTYTMDFSRLPAGQYVASVTQGGRTQTISPFQFTQGAGDLTVVLRKDGGTVSGTAFSDNGSATQAFVAIVPKNRKDTLRFRTATTAKDGSFTFSAVAPGEYDVFAFTRNDEDWYQDEDYLRRYSTRAVAIEVKANGSATAQPKLISVGP